MRVRCPSQTTNERRSLLALTHVLSPDAACSFRIFNVVLAGGLQMPLALSQLLADPLTTLAANPEWTRYSFMFPVGILVATCAQTAGIGGAAIMGPFFLLGLPLLGPAYPLHSVAASVATAILSEAFGFSSGTATAVHTASTFAVMLPASYDSGTIHPRVCFCTKGPTVRRWQRTDS